MCACFKLPTLNPGYSLVFCLKLYVNWMMSFTFMMYKKGCLYTLPFCDMHFGRHAAHRVLRLLPCDQRMSSNCREMFKGTYNTGSTFTSVDLTSFCNITFVLSQCCSKIPDPTLNTCLSLLLPNVLKPLCLLAQLQADWLLSILCRGPDSA